MAKGIHEWWSWVPLPTSIIKNEDDIYMFKLRAVSEVPDISLHLMVTTSFNIEATGCSKCQRSLKEVFGEPCEK